MAQAFVSTKVVTPEGVRAAVVLVREGKIAAVTPAGEVPADCEVHDFGERALLPGLVDPHVHINEPGRTEWEGFATATRAAAAGGYTTLMDMPLNCLPATTTVDALTAKRDAAAGKCMVDWAAWGGVSGNNAEHIEPLAAAGVRGFKCFLAEPGVDGFFRVDEAELRKAGPHLRATGLPLLVHAELPAPLERAAAALEGSDWRRYATYLASRPDAAEVDAIALMLSLCREYGFRLHIVHLATEQALGMLREARAEGLPVTVETCPHYLYFAAEEIADGSTLHKCAPPIRSGANREALWRALVEGDIDMIGTDHSPCPPEMKRMEEGSFKTAWGGISSLAVALPVVWTGMREWGLGLDAVAQWMALQPAKLAGFDAQKGAIAVGNDADFMVFDEDAEVRVAADALHFRHAISPYVGETLRGRVEATYVRGACVFEEGAFAKSVRGRAL
ncbi:MAG TPA: allantoinase AllB [Acidobacteriaceae bacterium]|nr:allantoinase AllB [Acidobacteriaceae bacterium]